MQDIILTSVTQHELSQIIEQSMRRVLSEKTGKTSANATVNGNDADFLTIGQASEFLNIPVATLYDYTHKRKIPFNKIGKKLLFNKTELIEWIKTHRRKTHAEISQQANDYLVTKLK